MTDTTDTPMQGLLPHEQRSWLPAGDDLPDWISALRAKHAAALDEWQQSIAGVVNTSAQVEADARQWRREVRNALAQGKPAPEREHPVEVGEAQVEIAADDAEAARRDLAEVCIDILAEIRTRLDDFAPFFLRSSGELRAALHRGPDGLDEAERKRRERLNATVAEITVPDVTDPDNADLVALGQQEEVVTNAAS